MFHQFVMSGLITHVHVGVHESKGRAVKEYLSLIAPFLPTTPPRLPKPVSIEFANIDDPVDFVVRPNHDHDLIRLNPRLHRLEYVVFEGLCRWLFYNLPRDTKEVLSKKDADGRRFMNAASETPEWRALDDIGKGKNPMYRGKNQTLRRYGAAPVAGLSKQDRKKRQATLRLDRRNAKDLCKPYSVFVRMYSQSICLALCESHPLIGAGHIVVHSEPDVPEIALCFCDHSVKQMMPSYLMVLRRLRWDNPNLVEKLRVYEPAPLLASGTSNRDIVSVGALVRRLAQRFWKDD